MTLTPNIYARARRHWLSIRAIKGKECVGEYEAVACIAVRGVDTGKIIASGREAIALSGQSGVILHHAFVHPRVFVAGVDDTVMVVRQFIQDALGGKKPFLPFPMAFQVEEVLEEGFNDVETRTLIEIGLRAGARDAIVSHSDHVLSNAEVVQSLRQKREL